MHGGGEGKEGVVVVVVVVVVVEDKGQATSIRAGQPWAAAAAASLGAGLSSQVDERLISDAAPSACVRSYLK